MQRYRSLSHRYKEQSTSVSGSSNIRTRQVTRMASSSSMVAAAPARRRSTTVSIQGSVLARVLADFEAVRVSPLVERYSTCMRCYTTPLIDTRQTASTSSREATDTIIMVDWSTGRRLPFRQDLVFRDLFTLQTSSRPHRTALTYTHTHIYIYTLLVA